MKYFLIVIFLLLSNSGYSSVLPTAEEILRKYDTDQSGSLEYKYEVHRVDYIELEKPLRSCMDDFLADKDDMYR